MMNHTDFIAMIPFYVAQTLTDTEKRAFEAYLASHPQVQTEIDQWQTIATATWQEADQNARRTRAFPKDVYAKLPTQTPHNPLPNYAKSASIPVRQKRATPAPVTWVAGFIVIAIFGGLALMMLNKLQTQPLNLQQLTPQNNVSSGAALIEVSPTVAVKVVATATPLFTEIATVTATVPFSLTKGFTVRPTVMPPTLIPMQSVNVSATPLDPNMPNCQISASKGTVNLYAYASRNAPIVGFMQAGEVHTTYVQSYDGWIQYYRYADSGPLLGWIAPQDVDLVGYCALWTATPTLVSDYVLTPTPTAVLDATATPIASSTWTPTPAENLTVAPPDTLTATAIWTPTPAN